MAVEHAQPGSIHPPFRRLLALSALGSLLGFAVLLGAAGTASAEPPSRLATEITDTVQALDAGGRADVEAAIDDLYDSSQLRLWVTYVA
ncbi:MAG: hypothetical protein WBB99_07530, partial [Rhodococcus sp. (in: high G+C Gram-positive bacteria)]